MLVNQDGGWRSVMTPDRGVCVPIHAMVSSSTTFEVPLLGVTGCSSVVGLPHPPLWKRIVNNANISCFNLIFPNKTASVFVIQRGRLF